MSIKFKPGGSIGLLLQSKSDRASSEELNQMVQEIRTVVEKYEYKVGSYGAWSSFQKFVAMHLATADQDEIK